MATRIATVKYHCLNDHGYESCTGHEMTITLSTVTDHCTVEVDGKFEFGGDTNYIEALIECLKKVSYGDYFGPVFKETK